MINPSSLIVYLTQADDLIINNKLNDYLFNTLFMKKIDENKGKWNEGNIIHAED